MIAFREWLTQLYAHLGYPQILLLMAMESSLLPVPSELVMIPAGYFARAGQLDAGLAIACGAFGSLLGASVNYAFGRGLGRPFLLRYGRYVLIDAARYTRAEQLFLRNARLATFVGRLLPAVRHAISLPAGVFRMPLPAFALFTLLGSGLWSAVLVACGWYFGAAAVEWMSGYVRELALAVAVILLASIIWSLRRRNTDAPGSPE